MEKVPRKKARKPLKKRTMLFLLLAAAALCAAGVYFLNRPTALPPIPETPPVTPLLSRDQTEISAIAITPPSGGSYPLLYAQDTLTLLDQADIPLREDVAAEILLAATHLDAERTVVDTATERVDLSHFGLSPAKARAVITYTDGSKQEVLIGSESPEETPQRYCMIGGDSAIYTVLSASCEAFFYEQEYLRAFDQPELDGSLLDRIDISGQISLGMRYTPTGWLLDAPYAYPLSTSQTDYLLAQIEGMAFESCLGEPGKLNLSDYGLDSPALTIRLTQAPTILSGTDENGETITQSVPQVVYDLQVGAETGASGVYVLWEGMVYKASNFLLGFWKTLTLENMLLQKPVNFLTNNLSAVLYTAPGVSAAYAVRLVESVTENNQIAADEYGQTLYDVAVRRQGATEDLDAETFLNWYVALAGLAPAGKLPAGYAVSGEKQAEIVLQNETMTRRIAFYPYDALHWAMAVDGVSVYYVEKSFFDTVRNAP